MSKARRRRALLAVVIVAVAGMLMASPAAWAVVVEAANWQMNETSGKMLDSSPNGNDGSPTDVLQRGSTYTFNGSTSRVAVPDNDSLDPWRRPSRSEPTSGYPMSRWTTTATTSSARASPRPRAATTRWR